MKHQESRSQGTTSQSKIVLAIFIVIVVVLVYFTIQSIPDLTDYVGNLDLLPVPDRDNLYYDPQELIVYVIFKERKSGYQGYGYMSSYYASNGRPYSYDPQLQQLVVLTEPN